MSLPKFCTIFAFSPQTLFKLPATTRNRSVYVAMKTDTIAEFS